MYSFGDREAFEEVVETVLEKLPEEVAMKITNVEIVVEDLPTHALSKELGTDREGLLGLYQGIPLPERSDSYAGVLPDRIHLYRTNIEREARSRHEVEVMIRQTLLHEIAHYFGIGEERLAELGWD